VTPPTITAEHLRVAFRPFADRKPTLRRALDPKGRRLANLVVALDDVGFEVARGEAFGVIGRNGAGKSTLLRVLAGTLVPDEGSMNIIGRTSALMSLGVGFNPELSGRRNVYLGGLASGYRRREIDELFDRIVEYAEVEEAIDRPLKTYSSGMYARLAFSVAMHLDPDILLLDEVLAVGDESFREKSMDSMRSLLGRSGAVVVVSHNLPRVRDLCDRVMWLHRGKIRAIGDAETVVDTYQEWSSRGTFGA